MATYGAMGSLNMSLPRGRLMKCHSVLFVTPDTLNTRDSFRGKGREREKIMPKVQEIIAYRNSLNLLHNYKTFFLLQLLSPIFYFLKNFDKRKFSFFSLPDFIATLLFRNAERLALLPFFSYCNLIKIFSLPPLSAPLKKNRRTRYILN
jgi:hypothetical protein